MSNKKKNGSSNTYRQRAVEAQKRKMDEQRTIGGLRRLIIRMQIGGLMFVVIGLLMPSLSPFYAEKSWKMLIGVTLTLPTAVIIFGCIMLIASILAFLISYRCSSCGGLMALTPYSKPKTCRNCGAKISLKDTASHGMRD